jgi:signal transduction histidine kinase
MLNIGPPLNIRQRLPLYISISALLIMALQGIFIYRFALHFSQEEFKGRITERLDQADSLIQHDPTHPFTALGQLPPGNLPEEKIYFAKDPNRIILPSGEYLLTHIKDTAQFNRCTFCYAHIGLRDYGIRHDPKTHKTLVVSAIDRFGLSKLQNLRNGLILGIILSVLLLSLVSWFWVKRMLEPIAVNISKVQNIDADSLNLRLDVKNMGDELGQLALTFNAMLERIEGGFRNQQQFIRNASHEMRTPLTSIATETELALQSDRSSDYYRQALQKIRRKSDNLNEMVSQLLIMAKIEAGTPNASLTCEADEALLNALCSIQNKYPDSLPDIKLQLDSYEEGTFKVSSDLVILQTAFFNLIDNAVKYGNHSPISLHLMASDQVITLEVKDQGEGIDSNEVDKLFEPFYRSSRHTQMPGSGIGLSLVKTVSEKVGGKVELRPSPEGGVTVTMRLPRSKAMF